MTSRVSLTESAVRDLEAVRDWYVSQSAPDVGERLVREVLACLDQLVEFPESGRVVPEFEQPWLRELVRPPFRIVYRVDGDRIRVVRVWRSERLMGDPLRRARAADAVASMQGRSVARGAQKLSDAEIEAEIAAARKAHGS